MKSVRRLPLIRHQDFFFEIFKILLWINSRDDQDLFLIWTVEFWLLAYSFDLGKLYKNKSRWLNWKIWRPINLRSSSRLSTFIVTTLPSPFSKNQVLWVQEIKNHTKILLFRFEESPKDIFELLIQNYLLMKMGLLKTIVHFILLYKPIEDMPIDRNDLSQGSLFLFNQILFEWRRTIIRWESFWNSCLQFSVTFSSTVM